MHLETQRIEDLRALSGLCSLEWLWLGNNALSDASPLAALHQLSRLSLENNRIAEPMAAVASQWLVELNLSGNPLSTLEPLAGATAMKYLFIDNTRQAALRGLAELKGLYGLSAQANYADIN